MSSDGHTHHEIDYIEIEVVDMAEARRFYGQAFGWTFTDHGPGYAGIRKSGGGGAGGLPLGSGAAGGGGRLVILYSRGLDARLEAGRRAGGGGARGPLEVPGGRSVHV